MKPPDEWGLMSELGPDKWMKYRPKYFIKGHWEPNPAFHGGTQQSESSESEDAGPSVHGALARSLVIAGLSAALTAAGAALLRRLAQKRRAPAPAKAAAAPLSR